MTKEELLKELLDYAKELRGDWSDFDGRDLLAFIDLWCAKMSKELGIEYHSYYEPFWPTAYSYKMKQFEEAGVPTHKDKTVIRE